VKLTEKPGRAELNAAMAEAVRMVETGRSGPAVRLLKDIARHRPDDFDIEHLLGAARVMDGRFVDGIRHLERAATLRPKAPAVWINLAAAHEQSGAREKAVDAYGKALTLAPTHAQTNHRLCLALLALGRAAQAEAQAAAFRAANPRSDEAHVTAALVDVAEGRDDAAIESLATARRLAPANTLALANLAFLLGKRGRYAEALPLLEDLVARRPSDWEALEKLVHTKRALLDWSGLAEHERRLLDAVRTTTVSVDPWTLFSISDDPGLLRNAAMRRSERITATKPRQLTPAATYPHSRIRIGYLSGDFVDHPVAHSLTGLIGAHDRSRFEVIALSLSADDGSAVRNRLEASFDKFVDLAGVAPVEVALRMRELEIDIAVDVSGATERGSPMILAHRPARVQVSYLGYPGTSGAPWLDYLIADPVVVPPSADRHYTENVVRLPHSFFPPSRREIAPDPGPRSAHGLPAEAVVFASFNNAFKLSPGLFESWIRILSAVPGSVLWLRTSGDAADDRLRATARSHGVEADRLVFAPRVPSEADHLARLRLADLFLDSAPYNAHTTASDALWAGLPVLTVPGASFASRVAASLVSGAGLPELIVADRDTAVATAVALAGDPDRLGDIRRRLAAARENAPLFAIDAYARHLEAAFIAMHARSRAGSKPGPFAISGSSEVI